MALLLNFVGQQPGTPCIFDPNSQGQVLCCGQCSLRQDTYGRRGHSFGAAGGGLSDRTFPGSQQDFWSSMHCPFAMLILVFFFLRGGYVWQERRVWTGWEWLSLICLPCENAYWYTNTSMFHTYEFIFLANMPATSYSPIDPGFLHRSPNFQSIPDYSWRVLQSPVDSLQWASLCCVPLPSSSAQPRLGNGWRRPWCHRDWDVEVAHRLQTIWSVTPWRCGVAGAELADLSSAGCADRS